MAGLSTHLRRRLHARRIRAATRRPLFMDRMTGRAYRRIYHVHVRKTAGTSLNVALGRMGTLEDSVRLRGRGLIMLPGRCPRGPKRLVMARHDIRLLNRGDYHVGFSHEPLWRLSLPPGTFLVTVLRDPLRRLESYYRYLLWTRQMARQDIPRLKRLEPSWAALLDEAEALGPDGHESLVGLAHRAAPRHVTAQLWMFSPTLDPAAAARRATTCHAILRTEAFTSGLTDLAGRIGCPLSSVRERSYDASDRRPVSDAERAEVKRLLAPEYDMFERLAEWSRSPRVRR